MKNRNTKHAAAHVFLKEMVKMPRLLFVFALLLSVEVAFAQADIPVGSWRTHNAYNKTIDLTTNGQDLIAATSSALYLFNPEQNSSEEITGLNGLSDAGISSIGYNPSEEGAANSGYSWLKEDQPCLQLK